MVALAMLAMMVFLAAPAALALSCDNVSRAAPKGETSGPIVKGHWVWLPSIGVPFAAWGFDPPEGHIEHVGASLMDNSALCTKGKDNRQTDRGAQTGCE